MHENAPVYHQRNNWQGIVTRAPASSDRPGAFYRNDTIQFYVVWDPSTIAPHDEGTSYCTSIPGSCPEHDGGPAEGWIDSQTIIRAGATR